MGVLVRCNVTSYGVRGAVVGILPLNDCFEFQGLSPLARRGVRSGRTCECRAPPLAAGPPKTLERWKQGVFAGSAVCDNAARCKDVSVCTCPRLCISRAVVYMMDCRRKRAAGRGNPLVVCC